VTHLGRPFAWPDEDAMRAFLAEQAFAQITCVAGDRPAAAHAPLSVTRDGALQFRLARGNPLVDSLAGAPVLVTVVGPHGYISPDWYGTPDQVPTWNYVLVEAAGVARQLDADALRAQIDLLSAAQEALLAPKPAWTSAKMDPRKLALMLRTIVGFSIDQPVLRGVRKLGQNKRAGEAAGAVAGLHARGDHAIAAAMAETRS
jgi:transcriptional regulator